MDSRFRKELTTVPAVRVKVSKQGLATTIKWQGDALRSDHTLVGSGGSRSLRQIGDSRRSRYRNESTPVCSLCRLLRRISAKGETSCRKCPQITRIQLNIRLRTETSITTKAIAPPGKRSCRNIVNPAPQVAPAATIARDLASKVAHAAMKMRA
jgi:hypothetical protein